MRRGIKRFAPASGALVLAVLVRWLLDPWLGHSLPLVTLFGAIAVCVWAGGSLTAIVVTVVGYFACSYLFIEPRGVIHFGHVSDLVGSIAYFLTAGLIIAMGQAMRAAQVRANQRRDTLRVTLASIGDAVVTTDVKGRVTYLNATAESLTGWTQADAIGQPLPVVYRAVNKVLIRKDGGELPIDETVAPIRDEQGRVSGSVLLFRDVTAQRREAQEKSNQLLAANRLASIVESTDDAIISKSLDGIIQSWNDAAERVFGFTAEEAIGRHISLVIPPERIREEDHIIATLQAGRRIAHFHTERVRKDGRRILVSLSVSPIKDDAGNIVGAAKIARDVTRQRGAEERERQLLAAAAAANAKFQAFFEQGALLAVIMALDGTVIEANRQSCEGCGFAREQIVGKSFWEGPWWGASPELVRQVKAASARAISGTTFHGELRYFVADGTERIADVILLPIKDEAGTVRFVAPTGIDITDRKRAEADREQMADNLRSLATDLSEANRRKTEFLAMLAHELRNPLAPIGNAVRALRVGQGDPKKTGQVLSMLDRQVRQLSRLVDDLLDLSRVTRGKIVLRKQRVELVPIVEQAVEAVRALHGSMHHELTVTLPTEPVYLSADPARVAQVIGNLLNNACKFTDPGGHVNVTVTHGDGEAVIRVRDDGIGIAAEQLPHLFMMFSQGEASLERTRDGLGIGLTLVKALVEMHSGSVQARSGGLGRGSEFEVRLPMLAEAAVGIAPADESEPATTVGHRVLIVDDNVDGAESLAMLLEAVGHETHQAHDGIEAIAAVERLRPDAVLLDIGLPGLNGYEVCRRIRERPWGRSLLLVALTGWGQEEDRQRSREAGFDAHLVKPVDHDVLMRLLAALPSGAAAPPPPAVSY